MLKKKRKENIVVTTGDSEKERCTVAVCVAANKRILPPYVLKKKTSPKINIKGIIIQGLRGWTSL
jgi:hypothetical protein